MYKKYFFSLILVCIFFLSTYAQGSNNNQFELTYLKNATFYFFNELELKPSKKAQKFNKPEAILQFILRHEGDPNDLFFIYNPDKVNEIKNAIPLGNIPFEYLISETDNFSVQLLFKLDFTYQETPISFIQYKLFKNNVFFKIKNLLAYHNGSRWCLMSYRIDSEITILPFIKTTLSNIKPQPFYHLLGDLAPDFNPILHSIWNSTRYKNGFDIQMLYYLLMSWREKNEVQKINYFFYSPEEKGIR